MVPCPWFWEAADLAKEHRIPLGIHSTLTCEWDGLRWAPITGGPTLRGDDGTCVRTVPLAQAIDPADATDEVGLRADLSEQQCRVHLENATELRIRARHR